MRLKLLLGMVVVAVLGLYATMGAGGALAAPGDAVDVRPDVARDLTVDARLDACARVADLCTDGGAFCKAHPQICRRLAEFCHQNPDFCRALIHMCRSNPAACRALIDYCRTHDVRCSVLFKNCLENPERCRYFVQCLLHPDGCRDTRPHDRPVDVRTVAVPVRPLVPATP